jgi:hypothetical protein
MRCGEFPDDISAHRIADQVRCANPEVIEEPRDVLTISAP